MDLPTYNKRIKPYQKQFMYEYANNTTNNEIKFTKNLVCFVN